MDRPITAWQANHISPELRNELYSALLSGSGINNIEARLTHEMQRSGYLDNLRQYTTELIRSGEAFTYPQILAAVKAKIATDGCVSGQSNGATNNGTNGVSRGNGHEAPEGINLRIPDRVITEGTRTVVNELEKVCESADAEEDK